MMINIMKKFFIIFFCKTDFRKIKLIFCISIKKDLNTKIVYKVG